MALIKCPECGKEISDKAKTCPNCGCPIKKITGTENEILEQTEENNSMILWCRNHGKKFQKRVLSLLGQ